MKKNQQTIIVKGAAISIIQVNQNDYISLTDMVKNFDDGLSLIEKWLRNKNTVEFLGIWEKINNSDFNSPEFEGIMKEAGINSFCDSSHSLNKKHFQKISYPTSRAPGTALFEFAQFHKQTNSL